ncbi:hypothetical protein [Vibrio hangzhouensis]|uniref:Uncharacterized protein n=1 Tax=Vibrio hangzhouensis TaxID=462991 RepID=A0A1H5TM76_9VIBR|nr:hypothetical protein [Vibrio hangzhouensis]SEF63962.1 hypothetical protein SAMN04488244_102317 [Vibrio hangzhouensis]
MNIASRVFSVTLGLMISGYSTAGEVDNYYAWQVDIGDSKAAFNHYLNSAVIESLETINAQSEIYSCQEVSLEIMKVLGATRYPFAYRGALNTELEYWSQESERVQRYPSHSSQLNQYADNSLYSPEMRTMGVKTDLDYIVNINGVYLGTDKFSHFLGSGYEYYKRYLRELSNGKSSIEAQLTAIEWATGMEGGLLGVKVVGVYSYADLEANYQGFLMAKDLCEKNLLAYRKQGVDDTTYLWVLEHPIDISDYVNPNWDESFNASTYSKSRYKKVLSNLANLPTCTQLSGSWVKQQRKYYRDWPIGARTQYAGFVNTSFSMELLQVAQRTQHGLKIDNVWEQNFSLERFPVPAPLLMSFSKQAKLPLQSAHTIEQLCAD